ncbi:MAG: hypothetical protein AB7P17_07005 [Nitrospirales bacterium]|nr:hypothetical protein [Nitrospirales bacterium]
MPLFQVSVHGVGVMVSSSSHLLLEPVKRFLRYFPPPVPGSTGNLRIDLFTVPTREAIPSMVAPQTSPVSSQAGLTQGDIKRSEWRCDVYIEPDTLITDFHGQGLIHINFQEAYAQAYLIDPAAMHEDIRISYFHYVLIELLKRRGLYTLHATALEMDGQGLLIPGCSGRGKTTAFISLLRSGFRCVSDDHPLLRESQGRLELLAFEEKVDITQTSLKFFPELHAGDSKKFHQGIHKKYFYIEDFYPQGIAERCSPRLLLFPYIVDSPTSHVEPLSKARALEELLPETLAVHDKVHAKQEFQFLDRLVRQLDCYLLLFGNDVLDLPRLVLPLFKK